MTRHVFIDNSNIFGGAQRAAMTLEPSGVWRSVRVYYRNLFQLLENQEGAATRVMAGSVPPGNDDLWDYARRHGYDADLLRRVEDDDGHLVEQAVDELLHLKMANAILDHPGPHRLVIASGDGRDSTWGTSFPRQAQRALNQGWEVEIWSWQEQLTNRYGPMIRANPGRIHVRSLDPYYASITFARAGTYRLRGVEITVCNRIVAPLR